VGGIAAAFLALAVTGLAGWALLLVLAAMIVLGTVIFAAELARPYFIKGHVPHDEEEVRVARDDARQRRRDDFDDCTKFE
jgi:NhaP-type Na+/H+ or K+/H+ antiporter